MPVWNKYVDNVKILKRLAEKSVLYVEKLENGNFMFEEGCDNYYDCELTVDEVRELIKELQGLIK